MPDKQTEDLENKPTETQENTPDVSANQKEEEVSKNQENTEINLTNLQADIAKKLETVKDDTTKQKLEQMQKDVEDNKNDQDFLEKKAKELKGMKDTDPTRWEKNKTSVYKWFAKSSLGVGVISWFSNIGINVKDRFGIKDDPTMENKDATKNEKQSDRSTEKHTDNTDNTVTETSENTEEVTTENIDEAIEPAASSDAEKQPEISKSALKKEVSDAWNAFKKVSEGIDSSISMFTKDDKTILDDGKKLDVAYKKVMESLQKIPQLFSEDAEMQEFSREMMVNLSEYYSDRGVDNDHHTDPTKAVQLLLPAVTNLADKAGNVVDVSPMPSQDDLLKSISGTKLGNTIAEKIAAGQDMDTILKDEKISKERNEHYKKLFDKWETKFDRSIGKIYNAYKLGKYPNLTPMQKKSLELLKDMQGVSDRWEMKDRNLDMTRNIAGMVTAVSAGVAVTVLTGGAGAPALVAVLAGGATTTTGMWMMENKRVGGKQLAIDFALNTVPFGVGKAFGWLRNSAIIAGQSSKLMLAAVAGTYLAEGAIDTAIMSGGESIKTGKNFGESLEAGVAWAIFPLLLHAAPGALGQLKNIPLIKKILSRKDLAQETLDEIQRAKILAALGNTQLSNEILQELTDKLKNLKRKETLEILETQAHLGDKKDAIIANIKNYIDENVVLNTGVTTAPIKSNTVSNFSEVGDKVVLEDGSGKRIQVTILRVNGKDSLITMEGSSRPLKVNLTGGKLRTNDPAFGKEKFKKAYLAKHPKGGKVIADMLDDLATVKSDIRNIKGLTDTFIEFGSDMNSLSAIYPQIQRDIRNLSKGQSIDDFMGYKVTKKDKGFERVDNRTGAVQTSANSAELLNMMLPLAAGSGERLLGYKLQQFYRNNLSPQRIQSILQKNMLGRNIGKVKKLFTRGNNSAYEMEIAGEKYQIHFDPALPEGIAFKDLAGNVVDVNSSIGRKLELKVFEKISDKYQVFARECKDIKTPLGQIIPDAMKPKVLQAIADKLHKPITVVQQMSFGPFIESMQKFSDAPSMKRFIAMLGGGSKLNAAMGIGTILLLNDDDKSTEELGMEYVKYTFGGQLAILGDRGINAVKEKKEQYKAESTEGENFSSA